MSRRSEGEPIRVLVVDDSPTFRAFISGVIDAEPDMIVVKAAESAEEAVDAACKLKPNLITMDVRLTAGDGIAATEAIMQRCPAPVAVVTAEPVGPDSAETFRALAAGAVEVLSKPNRKAFLDEPKLQAAFVKQLRLIAGVGVVGIRGREAGKRPEPSSRAPTRALRSASAPVPMTSIPAWARLIAIGASTGGPPAIRSLLKALTASSSPPIVIAQHMNAAFLEGFVAWLQGTTGLNTTIAVHEQPLLPGRVYVAPGNRHLRVNSKLQAHIDCGPAVNYQRPSVDVLFESVAEHVGEDAIGVLLTGMGEDGARGLVEMRGRGATTLAQEERSCVVYGMPRAAIELGAAKLTAPPDTLGRLLKNVAHLAHSPSASAAASARRVGS